MTRHERVIEPLLRSKKPQSIEEKNKKQTQIVALLEEWNTSKNEAIIGKIQQIVPEYRVTSQDIEYLSSFVSNYAKIKYYIDLFQKTLSKNPESPIDGKDFLSKPFLKTVKSRKP